MSFGVIVGGRAGADAVVGIFYSGYRGCFHIKLTAFSTEQ
jgi:hypothetical protein